MLHLPESDPIGLFFNTFYYPIWFFCLIAGGLIGISWIFDRSKPNPGCLHIIGAILVLGLIQWALSIPVNIMGLIYWLFSIQGTPPDLPLILRLFIWALGVMADGFCLAILLVWLAYMVFAIFRFIRNLRKKE
jgi:hypothetical protein